jgi:uncharacterized sulfatase
MVRSATDGRYVYVRNYMPHLIYGQHLDYMFQTPTTVVWKKLHDEGKLTLVQDQFWKTKPPEELYDLQDDPDEVHNLAASPAHQEILKKLRQAQQGLARRIRDVGFLPEGEFFSRSPGISPYDLAQDDSKYPFERIFATAELASLLRPEAIPDLKQSVGDSDSAVRYWAAMGLLMRGKQGFTRAEPELRSALTDRSPHVRIVAAQILGQYGTDDDLPRVLSLLVELSDSTKTDVLVAVAALTALESLGDKARPAAAAIKALPASGNLPDARYAPYVPRLLENLRARP